jgi:hypothetical protein
LSIITARPDSGGGGAAAAADDDDDAGGDVRVEDVAEINLAMFDAVRGAGPLGMGGARGLTLEDWAAAISNDEDDGGGGDDDDVGSATATWSLLVALDEEAVLRRVFGAKNFLCWVRTAVASAPLSAARDFVGLVTRTLSESLSLSLSNPDE